VIFVSLNNHKIREEGKIYIEKKKRLNKGVCHTMGPCHLHFFKKYLIKAKEELWKLKYLAMQKT